MPERRSSERVAATIQPCPHDDETVLGSSRGSQTPEAIEHRMHCAAVDGRRWLVVSIGAPVGPDRAAFRVGRSLGTTIYRHGEAQPCAWVPDDPHLAARIVKLLNDRPTDQPTEDAP